MKNHILYLLLVLTLCAGFAVTALAETQSEFEELGIPVMQEMPETLPITYIIYDPNDKTECIAKEGVFEVVECKTEPSSKEGYMDITLTVVANLEYQAYDVEINYEDEHWTERRFMSNVLWTNAVYDYYTGVQYSFGSMYSDSHREITTKVRFNGRNYLISCSKSLQWKQDPWYWDDERGVSVSPTHCTETLVFTVPEAYNGLVYGLYELTELDKEPDYSAPDDTAEQSYIKDGEGGQFFRFGGTSDVELTDVNTPLYLDINNEVGLFDNGVGYEYTVTNYTDKQMKGCYAVLTYRPEHDTYYMSAQFHTFDIDLAPDEAISGTLSSNFYDMSQANMVWIEFDSEAERDAFFADSAFYDYGDHYVVNSDSARNVSWLEGLLGITLER